MGEINLSRVLDCTDNTTIRAAAFGAAIGLYIYLLSHLSHGIDILLSPFITDTMGWVIVGVISVIGVLFLIVAMRHYQ